MEIFRSVAEAKGHLQRPAVAIGNFDGVHLGHQKLLEVARSFAAERGAPSVLLTFEPHPARVLSPAVAPPLITTRARKLELLREAGVDAVVVQPFDRSYAATTPDEFVHRDLLDGLDVADVVVGGDFTFGKGRAGTVEVLRELLGERAIIHTVPAVMAEGLVVSSSKIRELLLEGRVAPAAALLGRPFVLDGTVVPGRGRGRTIGVPTANVAPETEIVPASGVYAVLAAAEGLEGVHAGAANLGVKPTFGSEERTVEVHLIDASPDLYGRRMAVAFLERLRAERRFESAEALVAQIRRDVEQARSVAARHAGLDLAPTA